MDISEIDYPKVILCDCDGVLTDGKFIVDQEGGISKAFHTRDVRAIRELISMGYEFYILTASSWKGAQSFAKKTGAMVLVKRDKTGVEFPVPYICIGDDAWDIELLKKAEFKFCPFDAIHNVREIENIHIMHGSGGTGLIDELLLFLKDKELYDKLYK